MDSTGYSYGLHPGPDGTWTLTANDISDTAGFATPVDPVTSQRSQRAEFGKVLNKDTGLLRQ